MLVVADARDLATAEAFFGAIASTGVPEHVVTDKAAFYL